MHSYRIDTRLYSSPSLGSLLSAGDRSKILGLYTLPFWAPSSQQEVIPTQYRLVLYCFLQSEQNASTNSSAVTVLPPDNHAPER